MLKEEVLEVLLKKGATPTLLLQAGVLVAELANLGVEAKALKEAGVPTANIYYAFFKAKRPLKVAELLAAGCPLKEIWLLYSYRTVEFKEAGVTANELLAVGARPHTLAGVFKTEEALEAIDTSSVAEIIEVLRDCRHY